ncbi:hypothetical protein BC567DRAFT_232126 [Phyllosticta citribraziliensis]
MSNQYFENNKNPPQLLEDYDHWKKETMTVVLIAGFKEFANGNLDNHRDSIFFRAGDRKAFGIITRAMERGIPGLEEAVEKHVRDGNSSPWPMRDWVIAGRCARDPKGKRGLLPAEIAITSPDAFNMTSKDLLLALDEVGKCGLNTPESISPGPVLNAPGPSTLPPASSVPHLASNAPGTSALATTSAPEQAPEPASTSNAPGPSTLPPASSAPGTASDAPGPPTLATTSAPNPASNAPIPSTLTIASNPGPALNAPEPSTIPPDSGGTSSAPPPASHPGPPSADPTEQWYNRRDRYIEELDPEEVFAQWRRFFSSSLSDNGGCVKDFAKHLDQQCYDLEIFRNHSEIPIWVKKMQFLHGLPEGFARAKAKFLRKHGRRLFRQDPERDGQGRVMEGNARAVTWDYLVEEMEKEEARLQGKRMKAMETTGYEPVERFLEGGEGNADEQQLMRETAESEKKAKKDVQDSKTICPIFKEILRDRFHVAAEGAASHASNAPPTRQEKDALPSRSSLKQPSLPTASGSSVAAAAVAAADATIAPPRSDKSKGKSTPTEKVKTKKTTKPNPPDTSSSKTATAQSSASTKKESDSKPPSSSVTKAVDPPEAPKDKTNLELPRTPVKRPKSVPQSVSETKNITSKQPSTTGSKVIKCEPLKVPPKKTIKLDAPVTSSSEVFKHEAPIKSDSQGETAIIPCTPPRKTIIDPRRIDVDPDTLPDYCNTCRKSGHADRTRACPRFDPVSGVIVGRDVGRALLPGKTEQGRLLKERDEVLAREKHAAEKAERKRARAEMKEREKSERQRREGVAGEEKGQVEVTVLEKPKNAPQATVQGDGEPATSTNAPNAATQVESQKKKKSKEKKERNAVRSLATTPVGARSDFGDRNHPHAAPETKNGLPVALPSQPQPTAIAGTKRKSDEVDEAADAIEAESKRRRQEKRRMKREKAKEKKERPLECPVGE